MYERDTETTTIGTEPTPRANAADDELEVSLE
jgi:hypothetical protein